MLIRNSKNILACLTTGILAACLSVAADAPAAGDESVSVRDFGAKCDGITDDTPAFRLAINSGHPVAVPAATCVLGSVNLKSNTVLFGAGEASILKQAGKGQGMLWADSGSADIANNIKGIVLRDLQLRGTVDTDGFAEHVHLLALNGVSNVLIERVTMRGFRGDGIYVGSSQTAGQERHNVNLRVIHSIFDGINNDNRNAISVIDGDGVIIEGNAFVNTTRSDMPGAIDFEPDASAFAIIRNVVVRNNTFNNIGGTAGAVAFYVQPVVNATVRNITVEHNLATGGSNNFFYFNNHKLASAAAEANAIRLLNNVVSGTSKAAFVIPAVKGLQIRGNTFIDIGNASLLGYLDHDYQVARDVDITFNKFVRAGATAGTGMAIFKADNVRLAYNKFSDCGTGVAAAGNAVDFGAGASSAVRFEYNEFSSPTGKTLVAIQKERAHTFTPSSNRFIANDIPANMGNFFQAED